MKILVASSIYPAAIVKLSTQHDVTCAFNASEAELQSLISDCDVLVFRSGVKISADVMACAPNLKLILRAGSGADNIDLEYVRQRGIQFVRIPGPGAKAVAELSFALMLTLARNILKADRLLRRGQWAKHELTGQLLTGKVLGLIGVGNIGERIGQLGAAWDMQVIGCVQNPSAARAKQLRAKGIHLTGMEEILAEADFISIQVPLNAYTRNLIDARALAQMRPGAFLVNVARGGIVDEAALYEALTDGKLGGAALDVHAAEGDGKISPLADLPNVVLTPHIGAQTIDSQREIGEIIINTIDSFLAEQVSTSFTGQPTPTAVI